MKAQKLKAWERRLSFFLQDRTKSALALELVDQGLSWFEGPPPGLRQLVGMVRCRWRIELDYRKMKAELGLDNYEGRHWLGWQHHLMLVSKAYAFLRSEQLRVKKDFWCDLAPDP